MQNLYVIHLNELYISRGSNVSLFKLIMFVFTFLKKFEFFYFFLYFKLIFFVFLDHFDALMLKIIFKK